MYSVELYLRVRLACHVDGLSQREAASRFGIARETVRKMLRHSEPPGYRRKKAPARPKLDPYVGIIDGYLNEDRENHRKQHHTAKRILARLREEHGFDGGYTIVKDYVREHRRRRREMFVPLSHPPGHAQADFGEADVVIAGVQWRAHFSPNRYGKWFYVASFVEGPGIGVDTDLSAGTPLGFNGQLGSFYVDPTDPRSSVERVYQAGRLVYDTRVQGRRF
jgi:transposase